MNVDLLIVAGILLLLSVLLVRYFFRIAIILVMAGVVVMYTGITVGDLRNIFSAVSQAPKKTELQRASVASGMGSSQSQSRATREHYLLKTKSGSGRARESMDGSARADDPAGIKSQGDYSLKPVPARLRPTPPSTYNPQGQPHVSVGGLSVATSTRMPPPSLTHAEKRDLAVEAVKTENEVKVWEAGRLLPLLEPPARRKFDADAPPVYHHI